MYAVYIMRRTQIYLDEDQAMELARRARARGVTASHVIREAVERYLSGDEDEAAELARQRTALRDAFGSLPSLPDGRSYVAEVRKGDQARDQRLQERWRSR